MKLGMFTCGYQYYPLERAFADAKRFGYDYIELWGGRPHAFAPDLASGGLAEVRALIDRYELPVEVYTPEHNAYPFNYMLGGEGQRREALDYLKQAMDQGRALGAAYTLVSVGHGGYALPRPVLWERMLESLKELARHGETIGHAVVVESLSHYPVLFYRNGDPERGAYWLKELISPGLFRREYPEVSYGAIEAYIYEMAGLRPNGPEASMEIVPKLPDGITWFEIKNIPFLEGECDVSWREGSLSVTNRTGRPITVNGRIVEEQEG